MDDEIYIIKVGTDEAVRNIADLRENIKAYKKTLDELEIGSEDYNNVLRALQVNQAALKDAMHATTTDAKDASSSMQDISKAAYGDGESYNALVRQMAMLTQEFRATEDAARRNELGAQINEINSKLKEMDAQRGNFQRNVGNYKSALDGLSNGFKATAGAAGSVINPLKNMTTGLQALSATPAIAMLGLMANALTKVGEGIKSDEQNTNDWNHALAAFKPIGDSFLNMLQSIGEEAARLANKFVDLLYKWGLLDEEAAKHRQAMATREAEIRQLQRQINIENANLEEVISDLRAKAAERDKYTAAERLKMLEEAKTWQMKIEENNRKMLERRLSLAKEEAALARNDAAANDRINQLEVQLIEARVRRNTTLRKLNREISSTKREAGKVDTEVTDQEIENEKRLLATWEQVREAMLAGDKAREEERARAAESMAELNKLLAESDAALTDSIQAELDAQLTAEWDAQQEEKRIFQARMQAVQFFANGVASIAGSIADIYEANGDAEAKAAAKAKGLRIAETTITTISGAVAAYMHTIESFPVPTLAIPAAVLNAATVLAAGYAQVRKIQATKIPGASSSSSAIVSAPSVSTPAVQQVRTITGASEEDRLNRMASSTRVYLVTTELEAKLNDQKVQLAEATFG